MGETDLIPLGLLFTKDIGKTVVVKHGDAQTMGKLVSFSREFTADGMTCRVQLGHMHIGPLDPADKIEIVQ